MCHSPRKNPFSLAGRRSNFQVRHATCRCPLRILLRRLAAVASGIPTTCTFPLTRAGPGGAPSEDVLTEPPADAAGQSLGGFSGAMGPAEIVSEGLMRRSIHRREARSSRLAADWKASR